MIFFLILIMQDIVISGYMDKTDVVSVYREVYIEEWIINITLNSGSSLKDADNVLLHYHWGRKDFTKGKLMAIEMLLS